MKKITLLLFALFALQTLTFAQLPNLGKMKDKAKKTVTKTAKDATNDATSTKKEEPKSDNSSTTKSDTKSTDTKASGNADGRPEYDTNEGVYRYYSIVRDESRSVKNQLKDEEWNRNQEGRNADAEKYWNKAKENLEKLRAAGESEKPYFKTFEEELTRLDAERKDKWHNYTQDKLYERKLENYSNWALSGWELRDSTLEPSYKGYKAFRKDFEASRPDKFKNSYVQSRIQKIDTYFETGVYEVIPGIKEDIDDIIKDMYAKNSRGEATYLLNASNYLKKFDKPTETITYNKKYLMEKTDEVDALQAQIDKEKAMLEEYISSGKFDAHVAKYRQEIIDAVRVGKSMMTNATYENMAKAGAAKDGTVKRVTITNATWLVKKNDYGIPLYKYLPVDIALTDKDGKCWLAYGQIRKAYEGGGVYGGEFFDYWNKQAEMNCANINK